jgi:hypothetical protein
MKKIGMHFSWAWIATWIKPQFRSIQTGLMANLTYTIFLTSYPHYVWSEAATLWSGGSNPSPQFITRSFFKPDRPVLIPIFTIIKLPTCLGHNNTHNMSLYKITLSMLTHRYNNTFLFLDTVIVSSSASRFLISHILSARIAFNLVSPVQCYSHGESRCSFGQSIDTWIVAWKAHHGQTWDRCRSMIGSQVYDSVHGNENRCK